MENSAIKQTITKSILTITLDEPRNYNAFDAQLIKDFTKALESADKNTKIRAVVICSNTKHFSTGANLDWMKQSLQHTDSENETDAKTLARMLQTLSTLCKPTIALVNGAAYGGASGVIACCDIAIAARDAKFCFSEVKLGLTPSTIAPYVVKSIGYSHARRYFLTAEPFNAEQALAMGLVHELVDNEALRDTGMDLAHQLKQNGPTAMASIKALLNRIAPVEQSLIDETAKSLAAVRTSEEAQEGITAFFEKRPPNWCEDSHD